MEDRMSGVQDVLDGFRKKLDDIHKALNEQKQYDMGVKIDAVRAEMQSQIDRLSREVQELQVRVAGPGAPKAPAVPVTPA